MKRIFVTLVLLIVVPVFAGEIETSVGKAQVRGEVADPGFFEIEEGESALSLLQKAGGPTRLWQRRFRVINRIGDEVKIDRYDFKLKKLEVVLRNMSEIPIQTGVILDLDRNLG